MLHPDLAQLLTTGGALLAECCNEDSEEPLPGCQGDATEGNPFNFSPQLIHLHKDHELFEVSPEAGPTCTAHSRT